MLACSLLVLSLLVGPTAEDLVSIKVSDVPLRQVVQKILDGSRAPALGALVLCRPAADKLPELASLERTGDTPQRDDLVDLVLNQTPFKQAMNRVFDGSGLSVAFDPDVPDFPVQLNIRSIRRAQVVRLLVRMMAGMHHVGLRAELKDRTWQVHLGDLPTEPREDIKPTLRPLAPDYRDAKLQERITLDVDSVPLAEALQSVFRGTGSTYLVPPDLSGIPVTVHLKGVPALEALRDVVRAASEIKPGVAAANDRGTYVFFIDQKAVPPAQRLYDLSFATPVPVEDGVRALLKGTGYMYTVENGPLKGSVQLEASRLKLSTALTLLLRAADRTAPALTADLRDDTWVIRPGAGARLKPLPPDPRAATRVSVNWEGTDVRSVLQQLAGASGLQIVVGADLPKVPVRLKLIDETVATALERVQGWVREQRPDSGFNIERVGEVYFAH